MTKDDFNYYPITQRTYVTDTEVWQCPYPDCSFRGSGEQVSTHREHEGHHIVPNVRIGTPTKVYTCSYCKAPAAYVGAGQDGDFYCKVDKWRAPGAVEEV